MTRPEIPEDDRPDYDAEPVTEYHIILPDGTEGRTRDAEQAAEYSRAGCRVTATTGWE